MAGLIGCTPEPTAAPIDTPTPSADPSPAAPAYAGTWIGPELQVSFAGPWVLIGPREPGPGAQPIELRVTVERREGDAFALQTSIADRYTADWVRPSDWTLLIEDGSIALAMGDEPLTSYVASETLPLVGPELLDVILAGREPELGQEEVLACIEVASEACRELEAGGPWTLGCREAQWAVCVVHLDRGQADPTVRSATAAALAAEQQAVAERFAAGLRSH